MCFVCVSVAIICNIISFVNIFFVRLLQNVILLLDLLHILFYNRSMEGGENLKERIKKIRRELDLTQQEFADRLGIKRGTISTYDLGRNDPVDSGISLICRELNVSEEWLRDGNGDMFITDKPNELDALVMKYGLSDADQVLIEKYISLKPKSRDTIIQFISEVSEAIGQFENYYKEIPDTPEELEAMYPPVDIHKNSDVG